VSRYLSLFGFVAHLGDLVTSPFRRVILRQKLLRGSARVPGALIVGLLLCAASVTALYGAVKADQAKDPVTYSIDQLSNPSFDRGGRDYAVFAGALYPYHVVETKSGSRQFAYFLMGDADSDGIVKWIVVRSTRTFEQMEAQISSDGRLTVIGMLTNDSGAVGTTRDILGSDTPAWLNASLVLQDGARPLPVLPLLTAGLVSGPLGLLLLISWLMTLAVGYVVFKPAATRTSLVTQPGTGFMPVRVTGLVSGYRNGWRHRELRADLRVPEIDPALGQPIIELVWKGGKRGPVGVRLVPGTTGLVMGTAYPFSGARPAMSVRFGNCDVVLSFDTEAARDAAFDQLGGMAGLVTGPNGVSASVPVVPGFAPA
jgi:hypothetical protein